jgi:hypothetical protein
VKKFGLILLLALMVMAPAVGFAPASRAQAAAGLAVTVSDVQADFPASITFSVQATSDQPVTDIRLRYTVARHELAMVVNEAYVVFTPGTTVSGSWVWDMRKTGGLPPGTGITYWWRVADAGGRVLETEPRSFSFDDERYDWHRLTEGMVTLYWYNGDNSFAAQLMAATRSALTRLDQIAGASLNDPVKLYIYKDAQALQGALIFAQEWTGGVAFSQYGTIVIGVGTSQSELAWGETTIPHELTHLVVGQVTENPYGGLPTWLNEGLAMVAQGPLDASFSGVFQQALDQHALISVRSLASPFSVYASISYLAYAESYEITSYLLDTYGRDKMLALLNVFAQGSTYDDALRQVYGFDMDGLNAEWQASLGYAASA